MILNRKKIELELERLGKTKSWLAREMGATRQWIDQIINDDSGKTLETISKIGKALGVDPKDLII